MTSYWDDIVVPGHSMLTTNAVPTVVQVQNDGAGSNGVWAYSFDAASPEQLHWHVQMPRQWRVGSDIIPAVYWMPSTTNTGDCIWQLDYSWSNIGSAFGASTLLTITDAGDGTVDKIQRVEGSAISGTGKTASSIVLGRIRRDANDGGDTFTGEGILAHIVFHISCDRHGDMRRPGT